MLTIMQIKVYRFIESFYDQHGYAPTTAEIAEAIGIQSRGVAYRYIKALSQAGYIQLIEGKKRNIKLSSSRPLSSTHARLPLLGKIAAGQPIEAVVDEESIDVASLFVMPGRYVLRVQGDSMVDEGILDGDLIVCHQTSTADDGQIVVALIDGESATLKRIRYHQTGMVTLLPANAAHSPQTYPVNRVKIQGVYVGLLRFS